MLRSTNFPELHGYRLERDEDVLSLRRQDGSLVGHFSARGVTKEGILHAIEDDRRGYPLYCGPDEHAVSVRRYLRVRMESPWEKFLDTERRTLEARRRGQLAKSLLWILPCESREEIERITLEDHLRADEGFVELRTEEDVSYKHIEQLMPEDRQERMRAELRRLEWLLERQRRRNSIMRSAATGKSTPHKPAPRLIHSPQLVEKVFAEVRHQHTA
ncbi:MAG TPA: hypothetical protein VFI90_04515 [Rubrobacter sp.]|nr:hypothetical protein [Rubrobacter sp.]